MIVKSVNEEFYDQWKLMKCCRESIISSSSRHYKPRCMREYFRARRFISHNIYFCKITLVISQKLSYPAWKIVQDRLITLKTWNLTRKRHLKNSNYFSLSISFHHFGNFYYNHFFTQWLHLNLRCCHYHDLCEKKWGRKGWRRKFE